MPSGLARFVPIVGWLPVYRRSSLGRDSLAALAVWAVLVPQAVAYAALAGAPPEAGLATALAAGVLYAIFGTCRELDVGPSSTIAITAAAVLIPLVASYPGDTYAVAARSARDPDGRCVDRGRSSSARLRRGVPGTARPRRLHQRDRSGDHRHAGSEAPRHLGRERQRARDGLARVRRARRHQLGDDPRGLGVARSCCSLVAGSLRSFHGRSSSRWSPSPSVARSTSRPTGLQ